MTDFEVTSLAFQELAAWAAMVSAVAAAIAAVGIWNGIAAMVRANRERAAEARADRQAATAADERRHAETMAVLADQRRALETLIERTAPAARSA